MKSSRIPVLSTAPLAPPTIGICVQHAHCDASGNRTPNGDHRAAAAFDLYYDAKFELVEFPSVVEPFSVRPVGLGDR